MKCEHINRSTVLTPETIHHGKQVCADCGAFLRWLPKPETVERAKRNHEVMAKLKAVPLTEWAKGFLLSLEKQGAHFSPKQQAKLDELAREKGIA
jgi:hypothetical protein